MRSSAAVGRLPVSWMGWTGNSIGNAAGVADAVAHAGRQVEVVAVAGREVAAGLGDADDRPAAVQLGQGQAEVHVALEIERGHRRVARRSNHSRLRSAAFAAFSLFFLAIHFLQIC